MTYFALDCIGQKDRETRSRYGILSLLGMSLAEF